MLDLARLLSQLLVVLVAARLCGAAVARVGQPRVVGEMIAGLALGPSLLGALAPGVAGWLFASDALVPLATLSQFGVLLFLFGVGLRLDLPELRARAGVAVLASQASILVPLTLGLLLAPLLPASLRGPQVPPGAFALFLGAAMSVTAFPVLARILEERRLLGTRVGAIALTSAAVDDLSAWVLLAAVVAVARAGGSWTVAWVPLALTALITVGAIAARPLLARAFARWGAPGSAEHVALGVTSALGLALATEHAGVHALFGAFLAGTLVPRAGGVASALAARLAEPVTTVLLPTFFAVGGLRASIGLVEGAAGWGALAAILVVAIGGKLGGSAIAARLAGLPGREALALGALMNTRGLMELVILGVGLEIGAISPTLYTMMTIMALVTTAMATPLLDRLLAVPHRVDTNAATER